jgi:hypothetical protein
MPSSIGSSNAAGKLIAPETVARFYRWLLTEVPASEYSAKAWNVRDEAHHPGGSAAAICTRSRTRNRGNSPVALLVLQVLACRPDSVLAWCAGEAGRGDETRRRGARKVVCVSYVLLKLASLASLLE